MCARHPSGHRKAEKCETSQTTAEAGPGCAGSQQNIECKPHCGDLCSTRTHTCLLLYLLRALLSELARSESVLRYPHAHSRTGHGGSNPSCRVVLIAISPASQQKIDEERARSPAQNETSTNCRCVPNSISFPRVAVVT